jgi:hypothetical protein
MWTKERLNGKRLEKTAQGGASLFVPFTKLKSRRMRWAGNVEHMGRTGIHIGFWWETQKERDHWETPDVGGRIIIK